MRRLLLAVPLLSMLAVPVGPAHAGGGCHEQATEGRTTTVRIVHACFSPTVVQVPVGATVRWENASGLFHNMTSTGDWYLEKFHDGTTYSRKFTAAGLYPYACTIHVGMVGVVAVGDRIGAPAAESVEIGTGTLSLGAGYDSAAEADTAARGDASVAKPADEVRTTAVADSADSSNPVGAWVAGALLTCVAAGLAIGTGRRRQTPVGDVAPHA